MRVVGCSSIVRSVYYNTLQKNSAGRMGEFDKQISDVVGVPTAP
jgi:hypothetical protein